MGPGATETDRIAAAAARRGGGALPNVIVIGAQKCGTSGMHFYLGLHPEIWTSSPKELNFFVAERNWPRGVEWYRSRFHADYPVRVEASPNYTAYPMNKGVPERMAEVVPDARLIFIVRDPIDRIAAHWIHNYSHGRHQGELETILSPKTSYIDRSRYAMQLERFLEHFPREQFHFIENEDLRRNRADALRAAFEFVGADPGYTNPRFAVERHRSTRKTRLTPLGERVNKRWSAQERHSKLSRKAWVFARGYWPLGARIERPAIREAIPDDVIEMLREDARRLTELTGLDVGRWSIWEQ